jgi:hypothetical protein
VSRRVVAARAAGKPLGKDDTVLLLGITGITGRCARGAMVASAAAVSCRVASEVCTQGAVRKAMLAVATALPDAHCSTHCELTTARSPPPAPPPPPGLLWPLRTVRQVCAVGAACGRPVPVTAGGRQPQPQRCSCAGGRAAGRQGAGATHQPHTRAHTRAHTMPAAACCKRRCGAAGRSLLCDWAAM